MTIVCDLEQKDVAALVDQVFGNNKDRQNAPTTENLDDLISSVFNNNNNNNKNSNGGQNNNNNGPQQPSSVPSKLGTDHEGCECVPYYQCQNGSILDNGVGLIDIR